MKQNNTKKFEKFLAEQNSLSTRKIISDILTLIPVIGLCWLMVRELYFDSMHIDMDDVLDNISDSNNDFRRVWCMYQLLFLIALIFLTANMASLRWK